MNSYRVTLGLEIAYLLITVIVPSKFHTLLKFTFKYFIFPHKIVLTIYFLSHPKLHLNYISLNLDFIYLTSHLFRLIFITYYYLIKIALGPVNGVHSNLPSNVM